MLYPIQANLLAQRSLSVSPQSVSQSVSLSGWQIYLLTYFLLSSLSVCLLFLLHLICSSFYLCPSISSAIYPSILTIWYSVCLSISPPISPFLLVSLSVSPSISPILLVGLSVNPSSLLFCSSVCPSVLSSSSSLSPFYFRSEQSSALCSACVPLMFIRYGINLGKIGEMNVWGGSSGPSRYVCSKRKGLPTNEGESPADPNLKITVIPSCFNKDREDRNSALIKEILITPGHLSYSVPKIYCLS